MSHLTNRRVRGPIHHFNRAQKSTDAVPQAQLNGTMTFPAPMKIEVEGLKSAVSWLVASLMLLVIVGVLVSSNIRALAEKPTTVEVKNTMRIPYGFSVPNSEKPDMLYRPQTSKQYNI